MAKLQHPNLICDEEILSEEIFLLAVQAQIQSLLNEKKLRYRDLSKRLGVSEARVSQMLGDEAVNLTIRTVARIFYKLGEMPVILSQKALEKQTSQSSSTKLQASCWKMFSGDTDLFEVARAEFVAIDEKWPDGRFGKSTEWLRSGPTEFAEAV